MEVSNPIGRPPIMVESTIQKLEYAFAHGATDIQACLYADISKSSLYAYQQAHPDFLERKEALKEQTTMHAKLNVAKAVQEGKLSESQWWLERKAKDEFSTRSEHINANIDATPKLSEEEKQRIAQLLNANT